MKEFEAVPKETNSITNLIVDAAFQVHYNLGPGLLESVYEECLSYELGLRKLKFQKQALVPIFYDKKTIDLTTQA